MFILIAIIALIGLSKLALKLWQIQVLYNGGGKTFVIIVL